MKTSFPIFSLALAFSLSACGGQSESVTVEEEDAAMPMDGGGDEAEQYGEVVSEEAAAGEATQDTAEPGDMETVESEDTGM